MQIEHQLMRLGMALEVLTRLADADEENAPESWAVLGAQQGLAEVIRHLDSQLSVPLHR